MSRASLREAIAAMNGRVVAGELPASLSEMTDDSRRVRGDACGFVALHGTRVDGHDYVDKALEQGARVVFVEREIQVGEDESAAVVQLDDTRERLPELARLAYGTPSEALRVVGFTGTNGKTTSTYLVEALGRSLGRQVGVIGTVSHRYPGYEESSINTTPGVLKLAALLRDMVEAGVDWVALEVSSHGLAHRRLRGIQFDVGSWTNFSRDHLDFHGSMDAYLETKQRLFDELLPSSWAAGKTPVAILNHDDATVRELFGSVDPAEVSSWGPGGLVWYGIGDAPAPALVVRDPTPARDGWHGTLVWGGETVGFDLPLHGRFNVSNALGAAAACLALDCSLDEVASALAKIPQVPGRMEAVHGPGQPRVYVDYAHTPDALTGALESVRATGVDAVHVVFGAGGDRDPSKRPLMGANAHALADTVWVTNDNPRTEDPAEIAADILAGIPEDARDDVVVELDRRRAIARAVCAARPEDAVLVAGKGHEDYQIVGRTRTPLDDRELAREALADWPGPQSSRERS